DRDSVRRGLRPIHEIPDRLRGLVPRRLYRRQSVHIGEVTSASPKTLMPYRKTARPQGRNDDHRRHGDLRIRPNRPASNRTERRLGIDDICATLMSQLARGVLTRRQTNPPIRQSRKRWVDENATAWWLQARVPGRTIRSN